MVETQSAHRRRLEEMNVRAAIRRAYIGQASALLVGLTGIVVAGIVAVKGQPIAASIIAVSDIAGLVGVYLRGAETQKEERLERARILTGQSKKDT